MDDLIKESLTSIYRGGEVVDTLALVEERTLEGDLGIPLGWVGGPVIYPPLNLGIHRLNGLS